MTTRRAIERATRGGADVAFEALGGLRRSRRPTPRSRRGGRAVIVGMPSRDATITINAFSLAGSGALADRARSTARRARTSTCRASSSSRTPACSTLGSLIARRYPLDDINAAYDDLRSGAPGRGVITFG